MDVTKINEMDVNKLHQLVDFIEGMPSEVNKYVKRNFGEPYLNPRLYNGSKRNLHEYSTLRKYLKNDDVVIVKKPYASYYQSAYCDAKYKIMNHTLNMPIRNRVASLLDCYSYDSETIIHMELEILKILNDATDNRDHLLTAQCINNIVIPYKLQVHDLYTSLSVSQEFGNIGWNNHLYHLHLLIMSLIHNGCLTYSDMHNLSILLYLYFKELGIESCIEKYHLLTRFKYEMIASGIEEDRIEQVYEKITSMINERMSFGDALHGLINLSLDKETPANIENYNHVEKEVNGCVFFFKDNSLICGNEENLSNQIHILTKDTISSYVEISDSFDIFNISENDIGHIRNITGMDFGTVYDKYDDSMKYLVYYEGEFYLLFKIKMRQTIIYGISLTKDSEGNRKILRIKETTDYYYKFTSDL